MHSNLVVLFGVLDNSHEVNIVITQYTKHKQNCFFNKATFALQNSSVAANIDKCHNVTMFVQTVLQRQQKLVACCSDPFQHNPLTQLFNDDIMQTNIYTLNRRAPAAAKTGSG